MIKSYLVPRISLNPLCEYVVDASAARRTAIIKQCKFPASFITKWYNQAEDILSFYLAEIRDDPRQLDIEIGRLKVGHTGDQMEKKYSKASGEILSCFLQHEDRIRHLLEPYHVSSSLNDHSHRFIVNGVQISARPELILRANDQRQHVGFLKLYFGKEPLSKDRGELMACLLKHYFSTECAIELKNQDCMVMDVARGKIYCSPKTFKRRVDDIKASCIEIAQRWDLITL
jgi:hypothetical protein